MLMYGVHPFQLYDFEHQISAVAPKTLTDQPYKSVMVLVEQSKVEREKRSLLLIVAPA